MCGGTVERVQVGGDETEQGNGVEQGNGGGTVERWNGGTGQGCSGARAETCAGCSAVPLCRGAVPPPVKQWNTAENRHISAERRGRSTVSPGGRPVAIPSSSQAIRRCCGRFRPVTEKRDDPRRLHFVQFGSQLRGRGTPHCPDHRSDVACRSVSTFHTLTLSDTVQRAQVREHVDAATPLHDVDRRRERRAVARSVKRT